jgi:hypothetical protein
VENIYILEEFYNVAYGRKATHLEAFSFEDERRKKREKNRRNSD